jgi:hypothetical protein
VTEDPETIGAGLILIEGGFDSFRERLLSRCPGWKVISCGCPSIGISFGISSIAELQIDGGPYQRLTITDRVGGPLDHLMTATGDTTSDVQDIIVATKIRFVSEGPGRPAIGVRLATRLPTAGNESGIGRDTMDFYVTGLFGKTVESIRSSATSAWDHDRPAARRAAERRAFSMASRSPAPWPRVSRSSARSTAG